jgi:hypothetical protein
MSERLTDERLSQRTADLEVRLYHLICWVGTVTTFFVLLPVSVMQTAPWQVKATIVTFGVVCLALGLVARPGRLFPDVLVGLLLAALTVCWFLVSGAASSVGAFYELALLLVVAITRGWRRVAWVAVWAADVVAVIVAEYLHPDWIAAIPGRGEHLADVAAGLLVCGVAVGGMAAGVVAAYGRDRRELGKLALDVSRKSAEIRTLRGLLPMCAWCKKVRNDAGLWTQIEQYVAANTEAMVSHALCPDCARAHFHDVLPDEKPPG